MKTYERESYDRILKMDRESRAKLEEKLKKPLTDEAWAQYKLMNVRVNKD